MLIPLGRVMLLLLVPAVVWSAWRWGHSRTEASYASTHPHARPLQVTGSSMVPTLMGEFTVAQCGSCKLHWQVDPAANQAAVSNLICSHCGDPLRLIDRVPNHPSVGDVVSIRPLAAGELSRGDLVAIEWEDKLHVKRIAALPGDTVELDHLHLIVNAARLEDLLSGSDFATTLPHFLVDDDARRKVSRWSPSDTRSGSSRTSLRQWDLRGSGEPSWLLYHHQSVHDHHRRNPVWDDYPFNVTLGRKLHGVDRFSVRGQIHCQSPTTLEVALWSRNGSRLATMKASGNRPFNLSYFDAVATEALPVDAESPVAIRVLGGPARISELSIYRLIEYRVRPHDDRTQYPLQVGAGKCFVVGDNVPVSIDSRDIGLVPIASIAGVVAMRHSTSDRSLVPRAVPVPGLNVR